MIDTLQYIGANEMEIILLIGIMVCMWVLLIYLWWQQKNWYDE